MKAAVLHEIGGPLAVEDVPEPDVAEERSFEDGAYLLERGKVNDALYVVIEGNVELTSVSAAGWEGTLGVLTAGEVCGATSALDDTPSTVTAQAFFGEVRALALRRSDINRLVRLYPEIGIGLLRASLARLLLVRLAIHSHREPHVPRARERWKWASFFIAWMTYCLTSARSLSTGDSTSPVLSGICTSTTHDTSSGLLASARSAWVSRQQSVRQQLGHRFQRS